MREGDIDDDEGPEGPEGEHCLSREVYTPITHTHTHIDLFSLKSWAKDINVITGFIWARRDWAENKQESLVAITVVMMVVVRFNKQMNFERMKTLKDWQREKK